MNRERATWSFPWVARSLLGLLLLVAAPTVTATVTNGVAVVLAVGAPGEAEYGSNFVQQVQLWLRACERAGAAVNLIGHDPASEPSDRERLRTVLAAHDPEAPDPLWLVLIGHGTFDGQEARFNLRGPDVSARELAEWLRPMRRPLVVINTTSASAPFLNPLSGTNRIAITATRSGSEQNFTRFGEHFARALDGPASDLDQDGQVSVLEAFLTAAAGVREFYQTEGRLATEHALLDDNGDGRGTPADWFRGVRAVKRAEAGQAVDGARAHQVHLVPSAAEQALPPAVRQRRDALELEIIRLRERQGERDEAEYFRDLEKLLLDLARLLGENRVSAADAGNGPGIPAD